MSNYKFVFKDKEYELGEDNFQFMQNDEETPVEGVEREDILNLLQGSSEVDFDMAYYDKACESCRAGREEKAKVFKFLEYHFFIFTKEGRYVVSNISKEYEGTSFTRLEREGKVDNSYIVSIVVCENCGEYSIDIEQCEV
jgi:hypothetical protein